MGMFKLRSTSEFHRLEHAEYMQFRMLETVCTSDGDDDVLPSKALADGYPGPALAWSETKVHHSNQKQIHGPSLTLPETEVHCSDQEPIHDRNHPPAIVLRSQLRLILVLSCHHHASSCSSETGDYFRHSEHFDFTHETPANLIQLRTLLVVTYA